MAFYVICGQPECVHFAHATYVAQYLYDHLPNFKYRKNFVSKAKWPEFVDELNKKNKWHLVKSPIIWKELTNWGGKPYLIGDLGQFWEYCYCYYGLETSIGKENLEKLAKDNLQFFEEEQNNVLNRKFNREISIFGCTHNMVEHLIVELAEIPGLIKDNGIFLKLYDEDFFGDNEKGDEKKEYFQALIDNFESCGIFHKNYIPIIVDKEDDAVTNTDLLIFLEDFSRLEGELEGVFLKRCIDRMQNLADTLNVKAKRYLRVVFCNEGPSCLLATLLIEYCASIIPVNVVAVTASRGLAVLSAISEIIGVHVSKMYAPPVWGFVGSNEFVDEANILFKASILRPYQRALTAPEGSTLPQGTKVHDIRLLSYLVYDLHDKITKIIKEKHKRIESKLHCKPVLAPLRSLVRLLKIWYDKDASDQIISLGICSNGTFGIPPGVVFSQPSIQDCRHRWVPFKKFPVVNDNTVEEVNKLIKSTVNILSKVAYEMDFRTYSVSEIGI